MDLDSGLKEASTHMVFSGITGITWHSTGELDLD